MGVNRETEAGPTARLTGPATVRCGILAASLVLVAACGGSTSSDDADPRTPVPDQIARCLADEPYTQAGWRIGSVVPASAMPSETRTLRIRVCYDPFDASAAIATKLGAGKRSGVVTGVSIQKPNIPAGTTPVIRTIVIHLSGEEGSGVARVLFDRVAFDPANSLVAMKAFRISVESSGVAVIPGG
jgi:hypothetical protein